MALIEHESSDYDREYVVRTFEDSSGVTVNDEWAYRLRSYEHSGCTGWSTPGFHEKLKRGELLPYTPWEQWEARGNANGDYHVQYKSPPTSGWYTVDIPNNPFGSEGWVLGLGDFRDEIKDLDFTYEVQRAASQLYGQGHDTLTFLAEITKTRDLLKDTFLKVIRLLRTGKVPNWGVPGQWLEYRYGWRTLLYDIEDLTSAIQSLTETRKSKILSNRAGRTFSFTRNSVLYDSDSSGDWTATFEEFVRISIRGSVSAQFKPPTFSFNPFITGWELIPFSFVFDWFINVGQWLASMSFLTFAEQYSAAGGFKVDMTKTWEIKDFVPKTDFSGTFTKRSLASGSYVKRIPSSVPTFPQLSIRLDVFKYFDLVTLAQQLYGSRRR